MLLQDAAQATSDVAPSLADAGALDVGALDADGAASDAGGVVELLRDHAEDRAAEEVLLRDRIDQADRGDPDQQVGSVILAAPDAAGIVDAAAVPVTREQRFTDSPVTTVPSVSAGPKWTPIRTIR